MKLIKIICVVFIIARLSIVPASSQENGLNSESLIKLDADWEKAQLNLDYNFIESLLAEDFIWVHNHANTIDDKAAVLDRINRYSNSNNQKTKSRISKDVKVIIAGTTAIVSGYTIIDKGSSPIKYHFMRTYVETNGKCSLLANHTMAIPEVEE